MLFSQGHLLVILFFNIFRMINKKGMDFLFRIHSISYLHTYILEKTLRLVSGLILGID